MLSTLFNKGRRPVIQQVNEGQTPPGLWRRIAPPLNAQMQPAAYSGEVYLFTVIRSTEDMIEIRELDKDNGRKLWLECFPEDSEEFVSWYFKTVFTEGYGVYDGSELLSMVSIVDATMALRRRPVRANFQRAVATTASARGKGYASMLQKYVLNLLYDRGEGMCSLNTDIHDFYAQFGFSTYVAKELLRIMPSGIGQIQAVYLR